MRKIRQRDETDCAAACLAAIADHYRLQLAVSAIRLLAGTNAGGTTVLGVVQAAESLGFTAKGVKGAIANLPSVPLPCIAHVVPRPGHLHYVVLTKVTKKRVVYMDPAEGAMKGATLGEFAAIWSGILVLLAPGTGFQPGKRTESSLKRFWTLVSPHRTVLVAALIGSAVATILGLSTSIYVEKLLDNVIVEGNRPLLNLMGVAMMGIIAFRILVTWQQSLLAIITGQKIDAVLINAYYRRLMRLPQRFFDSMRVGDIISRVGDALSIRAFLSDVALQLVLNAFLVVFAMIALFFYSWQLAVFSLIMIPLTGGLMVAVNAINRRFQRKLMERTADLDSHLVESLSSQLSVRVLQLQEWASLKTEMRFVDLLRVAWQATVRVQFISSATSLVTQAFVVGLLWMGAGLVLDSKMTAGAMMSCYTLAGFIVGPLMTLLNGNNALQQALIAADRLFEIMDLDVEGDVGIMPYTPSNRGGFLVEGVTFRHPGRTPALIDVSFQVNPGELTVLAGESGSGKSTLLALFQRLYEPEEGRISLDGHSISLYTLRSLRAALAVVPQRIELFNGTIVENIAPGQTVPDSERLLAISRELGLDELWQTLPNGILTPLTEGGANLSGGQRQRIALARALYRKSSILLLDEPSSALDLDAEQRLIETLIARRDEGALVVVATHRAALLDTADAVIQLEKGRLVK
jgi:ABC-type bacteriocin/lantibiotic exporter with double-glycine peptidase domain